MKHIIQDTRERIGLNRTAFGKKYGIPMRTLENWEKFTAEAPRYLIDLLVRAAYEDDERINRDKMMICFEVWDITLSHDLKSTELEELRYEGKSVTEAIETARRWNDSKNKRSQVELRIYYDFPDKEDSDLLGYDTIDFTEVDF